MDFFHMGQSPFAHEGKGGLKPHYSALKPFLTEQNKVLTVVVCFGDGQSK